METGKVYCRYADHYVTEYYRGKQCKECAYKYNNEYRMKRYYNRRQTLITEMGGKCVDCGSDDYNTLQFDHSDASTKSFEISRRIHIAPMEDIRAEATKCELRCVPCHKMKSAVSGDNHDVPHGGGASGKRRCKCEPCRLRKNEYMREWKRRKRLQTKGM